jgi:hypothetical protein
LFSACFLICVVHPHSHVDSRNFTHTLTRRGLL